MSDFKQYRHDDDARFGARSFLITLLILRFGERVDIGAFPEAADPGHVSAICNEAMIYGQAAGVLSKMPDGIIADLMRDIKPKKNSKERVHCIMQYALAWLEEMTPKGAA